MKNEESGPRIRPKSTPFFRTPVQMRILAKVVLDERISTISELARFAGASVESTSHAVDRMESLGYVSISTQGLNTYVTNQLKGKKLAAAAALLMRAAGATVLAPQVFAPLEGLDRLFIFGSWAARYSGVEGRPPGDIDMLLLGDVDRSEAYAMATALEEALDIGLEVQVFLIDAAGWDDPTDTFWVNVKARPVIDLSKALRAAHISHLAADLHVVQTGPPYST